MSAVVFSDLDGTLLDLETYSCEEARPAVELLCSRGIPLVLCSSKTRAEIEHHRRDLALDAPFIAENGSAVFIPAPQGCSAIELGLPVGEIRRRLAGLRGELGLDLRGYADLSGAAGSRFVTVTGRGADKGQATRLLLELIRRRDPSLLSVGLGDGPNDAPMLAAVDLPYLVQKPSGAWAELDIPRLVRVEGIGPAGFCKVIGELFGRPAESASETA